jgi:hypothetical protein
MCIIHSNTLHIHDAMDIGLTFVLSLLGIKNILWEQTTYA